MKGWKVGAIHLIHKSLLSTYCVPDCLIKYLESDSLIQAITSPPQLPLISELTPQFLFQICSVNIDLWHHIHSNSWAKNGSL